MTFLTPLLKALHSRAALCLILAVATGATNQFATAHSTSTKEYSVLFVSGSHSNKAKATLLKDAAHTNGIHVTHIKAKDLEDTNKAEGTFNAYDLVFFSSVSSRDAKASFSAFSTLTQSSKARFIATHTITSNNMSSPSNKSPNPLLKGISQNDAATLLSYYDNGGKTNMENLAHFLNARIFNTTKEPVAPPIVYPVRGIYHPQYPQKIFTTLEDFISWKDPQKNRPVIGILFQRPMIEAGITHIIDETIAQLEAKNATVVPFFFETRPGSEDYTPMLQITDSNDNKTTYVDAIINFRNIHWASARKVEFEKLGVPVIQALTYFDGDQKAWEQSSQGITPTMAPFVLTLPEAAGVTDPWIVAATNTKTEKTEIIDYQLAHLTDKTLKVAALKYKNNVDKKITIMVWGNRDVGASFLNVPDSLRAIAGRLNQEGYSIPTASNDYFTERFDRILNPFYRSYELNSLIDDDLAELMPVKEYLAWFKTLPEEVQNPINEYWGTPLENFMVVHRKGDAYFVLPRIRAGNMLVMRQPPRADNNEEDKRIFHKGTIPMNHFYLAAYYYARQYWSSDAIIHLGTHGSHEYLPGKERGLSLYDQSNLTAWDTPIIYPFIVDDVGEAMQTKRRGRATVLAHMTPPFAAADLHGNVAKIHRLMHEYTSMDEGGVKQKTAQHIVDTCIEIHICKDIGWESEAIHANFHEFMEELHSYMEELATQNQPLGLHTFGELAEQNLLTTTLIQMLGSEFTARTQALESAHSHDEHHHGHKHDHNNSHNHGQKDEHTNGHNTKHQYETHTDLNTDIYKLEDVTGFNTVNDYIINNENSEHLSEALQADIQRGKKMLKNIRGIQEMDNMIAALNGQYIPVKNGGDPIRHPDSLPTGMNLYGFDPARVPTLAAYEQGKELTEQLIADYYNKHGHYPDKLAFSLWSIETMRHYGVLESQALAAIGVKPKWSADGRVIGTQIIPIKELKRPRVDVILSATGLYRDAFPNVMQLLAKAIKEVAQQKEDNNSMWENHLWDNSQRVLSELKATGVDADEAEYLSTVRLFSNESGNYGSGLGDATIASGLWDGDEKLADLYLTRMGYYYGADDNRWGQKAPEGIDLYSKQLSGTDVALFSRSSNIFGMLASDDPFQYFGGLALAVRNIDGQSPEMMISNLRDAKNPKAQRAAQFLATEIRTRSLHPRWIKEMQKEGYSGAVTMASNVSNFFGWQVMDPNLVRSDQWQAFYETYVEDIHELALNEWFEEVDPKAQAAIIERMLEATRKEYWQTDNSTVQTLIERYEHLVNTYNLVVTNEKLREFVESNAKGFGLQLSLPAPEVAGQVQATPESNTQQVEGQKLEQVEASEPQTEPDHTLWLWLMGCLAFVAVGFIGQLVQRNKQATQ